MPRGKRYSCFLFIGTLLIVATSALAQPTHSRYAGQLKQADSLFAKKADAGISRAQQIYQSSLQYKDTVYAIRSLNRLTTFFWQLRQYEQASNYVQQEVSLAEKFGIDSLSGDALVMQGVLNHDRAHYGEAVNSYQQAIKFYQRAVKPGRIALAYLDIGWTERKTGRLAIANDYYFKAVTIFQALHDDENLAEVYNAIGSCYSSLDNYDKAVEFYRKSLLIRKNGKDQQVIAESYNNLGYAFDKANKPDSAIVYLHRAITLRERNRDSSLLVLPLQNIAFALKMKGSTDAATKYINRSLVIASKYPDMDEETARGNLDLAQIFIIRKNWEPARKALDLSEKIVLKQHLPELLMNIYDTRYSLYDRQGNYKDALLYYKKRDAIRDSLVTMTKNRTIDELEVKYQTREREKDIASLNIKNGLSRQLVSQQQTFIIVLIVAAMLLSVMLIFAIRNYRQKSRANERIQALMQDIHHRVKNNLQALNGLFIMQIESLSDDVARNTLRENQSRLIAMNLIHNKLYNDSTTTAIEMKEYLTSLLNHVNESFSQGGPNKIKMITDIEPMTLEADKAVAIGLIVNELATNSFKYAFKDGTGEFRTTLKRIDKKNIALDISDSGDGWEEKPLKIQNQSFGLKLVRLMIRQLDAKMDVDHKGKTHYHIAISL